MTGIECGNFLLYAGLGVVALAVLGFVVAWLCFRSKKKKLNNELENEYGKISGRGGN